MRTIIVDFNDLEAALKKAEALFGGNEWQAKCIEIALIPKIYRRLCYLNQRLAPVIKRVKGKSDAEMSRDERMAEDHWSAFAGYTFALCNGLSRWNDVRDEWYSHNPGSCWNGMCRELERVNFIHDLRMIAEMVRQGRDYAPYLEGPRRAGIEVKFE